MKMSILGESDNDMLLFREFLIKSLFNCREKDIKFVDNDIYNFTKNNVIIL
jgi:hypothetical protein